MTDTITPPASPAAVTANDVRRWIYEWFTRWEHRVPANELSRYLAEASLSLTFPGSDPITSGAGFADWYDALLSNTVWNFHELSNVTVAAAGSGAAAAFEVGMDISWHGEVTSDSEWPTNEPGRRFRFEIHQDWSVSVQEGDALQSPFRIVTLVARPQ